MPAILRPSRRPARFDPCSLISLAAQQVILHLGPEKATKWRIGGRGPIQWQVISVDQELCSVLKLQVSPSLFSSLRDRLSSREVDYIFPATELFSLGLGRTAFPSLLSEVIFVT